MKKMYKQPKDAKSLSQGYIPLAMMEKLPKKAFDKRPKKKSPLLVCSINSWPP